MSEPISDAALDAWITAGTELLGIPLQPAWRPTVQLHLEITFRHARNVMSFSLPDDAEPAPIFQA